MNPLVFKVAIGAASSLMQYYNAERARGASEEKLEEIKRMFAEVVPPQYNVSIVDPPEALNQIPPTAFDESRFTPELLRVVGEFNPEIPQFIQDQAPELIEDTEIGREGLEAQRAALQRLQQLSTSGEDPLFDEMRRQAEVEASSYAQSRADDVLEDAARRGRLGSGLEFATRLQAESDSANRLAQTGNAAAIEAYRNKMQAMRDAASLGGQMRSDELALESQNANIANAFNQRFTDRFQQYQNQRAQLANDAQLRNLQERQRVADSNVGLRNEADLYNRNRADDIAMQKRADAVGERDYATNQAWKRAAWDRQEIANQNDLARARYQDDMDLRKARSGIIEQEAANIRQNARDQNQAIQGMTDVGLDYMNTRSAQNRQNRLDESAQQRFDDRMAFDRKRHKDMMKWRNSQ